jgi:hypothetical protein
MPGCVMLKEILDAQDAVVWNRRDTDCCCHNRMGDGHNPLAEPTGTRRGGDQRFCHDDERDGPPGSAVRCVLIAALIFRQPVPAKLKPRTKFAEADFDIPGHIRISHFVIRYQPQRALLRNSKVARAHGRRPGGFAVSSQLR